MEIDAIKYDADLKAALATIETLWKAEPGTPDGDRLEVLLALVSDYEHKHHPMPPPDPIAAIEFMMEQKGLTRRDLEPMIGGRGRVAEILNRKRPLTLDMIRRLSTGLDLPADILIREYPLNCAA